MNENKADCHQCRIISFLKVSALKRSVRFFSDHEAANKTYRINLDEDDGL
jgi:hypothetical protein